MDATHESVPAPAPTPAPTPAPCKAGRPRKYPDLLPGEVGTYRQRHAIHVREQSRLERAANPEAFNAHKRDLYYKRVQKRKQDADKLATLLNVLQTLVSA